MSNIDLPDLKRTLRQTMRADLVSIVPWFRDNDLLLCPACCRALPHEKFSVEHILPKQAVAHDAPSIRDAVPRNQRSGITLLCRKPLVIRGRRIPGNGCNGWKGKHFDPHLGNLLNPKSGLSRIDSRGHVALVIACYLGMFRRYGYQIALLPSGVMMRRQFFHSNSLWPELPLNCQMIFGSRLVTEYDGTIDPYWRDPFRVAFERDAALITVRNLAVRLPLSRDPTTPVARTLPYAPSRYKLRPDLSTAFD